jgi:menaquinone-9 beta-reductase
MQREVIVVGAGPGGATAAILLAQKGYDVLLLDRSTFPRDKVCGDAVPGRALDLLAALEMGEKIRAAGFYPLTMLRLVSPRGYVMDAPMRGADSAFPSVVVPRPAFDAILQEHAVAAGAEFLQAQVQAPLLEDGRIAGVRARVGNEVRELHSRLVIGADGSTSTIARALRPADQLGRHRGVAIRAYCQELELLPHHAEFYLYEEILPGYAWIFPLGAGQANIGVGMRLDTFREGKHNLQEILERFLQMPAIRERLGSAAQLENIASWQLNLGSEKGVQRAYDGALLVGDAASLINPLTGGGIGNAVNSGWLAALVAHEAFLKGDLSRQTLGVYDRYCASTMWPAMRTAAWMQQAMALFPGGVDWIVKRSQHESAFTRMFMTKL